MRARRGRRESSLRWLSAAFTPWLAGLGLLVSFTADAGTENAIGSSRLGAIDAFTVPALPPGTALIGSALRRSADEPLQAVLKTGAHVFPVVQRDGKGDPSQPPAASFARRAAALRETGAALVFGDVTGSVSGVLSAGSAVWDPEAEPEAGFVPVPDLGLTTGSGSAASTGEGSADLTEDGETERRFDGSTPPVPRAVALSSTTPAPADAIPIEVAAASLALPDFAIRADRPDILQSVPEDARRRYADLIDPESLDKEQRCLSEAVYFEARSESEAGRAAVAQVVLNRVKSGLYPSSVCGVVYQNRHHYMGCQFSFACEGKSLRITDAGAWESATRIARSVIEGRTYLAEVGAATHYHADYVRPGWARRLRKMDVIGRHIFYQLKPGQT
ncbi:spore germination cell wall hydrolase CwlJ-like protein [Methylobacterium brachiatum]|uniref:Spore germination cell wall hydrolase CwlJ-like protein n=1 Tax=Methylobacterium brachiatum TaxID=269660 RepID=A0AAJ1X055_9HYPH|nr:spore germination cell wall hydrolase CwlJ-like protein [Methylobacterium brachiatum]